MEQEAFSVTVHASWLDITAVIVGAITLVAFIIILIYTPKTAEEARRANDRPENEMRPWLGVVDVKYLKGTLSGMDALQIFFKNIGILPAHDVVLSVGPDWGTTFIVGTVFPNESFNQRVSSPALNAFRNSGTSFSFNGIF